GCIRKSMKDSPTVVCGNHEERRTVRVNVIRTVLRIILEHEDNCVFPVRTLRQCLDDSAKGEIVIRHVGARCWLAGTCARSMIIRQRHYLERRHIPGSYEFLKLREPNVGTRLIG